MDIASLIGVEGTVPSVRSAELFSIFGFPVTNSTMMLVLVTVLFIALAVIARKFFIRPRKFQTGFEAIYEWIVNLTASIVGSPKKALPITPIVVTLILYIGLSNILTLTPFVGSLTYNDIPLFRSPMSDFNTTFGLAFAIIIAFQFISITEWGIFGYLGRFFQFGTVYRGFREGIGAGFMALIEFVIGLLDIISEVAKVISLSFRLFGNIFAGEVLLVIIFGAVGYVVPALWMTLGILFGLIQALVFGALTAAYYSSVLRPDDDELVERGY